jgi:hypothetical protein
MYEKPLVCHLALGCAATLGLTISAAQGQTKVTSSMPAHTADVAVHISVAPLFNPSRPVAADRPGVGTFDVSMLHEKTAGVVDAPYSAVGTTETVRFVDGKREVQTESERFFRDSHGRFRREYGLMSAPFAESTGPDLVGSGAEPAHVDIWDPIRGENYTLDTRNKTFERTPFSTGTSAPIRPPLEPPPLYTFLHISFDGGSPLDPDELKNTVSLGEKTIEGVSVVGSRLASSIQPGDLGNQRPITPITLTEEQWFSRELGVIVLRKRHTLIDTDVTYRLQQIVRTEPDPDLFVIPSDYTQREMSSTATTTFGAPREIPPDPPQQAR